MAGRNHKVDIIVGVRDLASRSLSNIQKSANSMSKAFTGIGTHVGAFTRNLDSAVVKMDKLANSMYRFNMYTSSIQRNLKTIGAIGAIGAGTVAYQGTKSALDFDYKTHIMQSRMETSSAVRKQIEDYILSDLNLKVGYNPTQIADTGIILGQAGVNNAADMKSMLKTVTYFSEAVDAIPADAAEMVISASKGFGISMENSQQITDKLTVALNKSLLHVEEMPHAIGELAGRANMFGQSLDSSLVALMTMRDQGMSAAQGSQDFLHALRQGSRIGNDEVLYKRSRGYFESLGITDGIFDKDTRKLKEFPELIADIEKAMINQGFSNPKYKITNKKEYDEFLAKNGGKAPQDFWDSMKAMPLITRVFGAAGQAPILMGMQSKYEEVNKETGEKTGKVYYGSDALKRMKQDVSNSDGAVDRTHDIVSQSGLFQLEVLKGAWDATQIKMLDAIVPVIKTGAEELTGFLSGGKNKTKKSNPYMDSERVEIEKQITSYDKFRNAIGKAAEELEKEGHSGAASIVKTVGEGAINTAQISTTMPSMFNQIGGAFNDNFIKADWGSSIIEFPWKLIQNGIGFITDIVKANEQFNDAVSKLPENLQDPAKLIETLTKGGLILLMTGAIVKTIELGIRGVTTAIKGAKFMSEFSKQVLKLFGDEGLVSGKKGKGGLVDEVLKQNKTINANVVNVYGKVVNNGGAGGTGSKGKGGKGAPGGTVVTSGADKVDDAASKASKAGKIAKIAPWLIAGGNVALAAGAGYILTHPQQTRDYVNENPAQKAVEKIGPETDKKINEMHAIIKNPSNYTGPREGTEIQAEKSFWKPEFSTQKASPINNAGVITSKLDATPKWVDSLNAAIDKLLPKQQPKTTYEEFSKGVQEFKAANQDAAGKINNSVIGGFNAANQILQNVKVNNNVSVNVAPPAVNISGNIKQYLQVQSDKISKYSTDSRQYDDEAIRGQKIMQRRLGWRE